MAAEEVSPLAIFLERNLQGGQDEIQGLEKKGGKKHSRWKPAAAAIRPAEGTEASR